MSDEDSDQPSFKRKNHFQDASTRKAPKTGAHGSAGGGKMSFAQRMMAKMGYKDGEGLGKGGEGMLNPIEVKLRPQGVGVGAVKEKTAQAKAEARRQAERRGETLDDSSEEERKARRKRKELAAQAARSGTASGASTPRGFAHPKVKYQTAADLEAATDGLHVPPVLKAIIDATGKQQRLITSTAGLLTPTGFTTSESEPEKIAKRARRELEGFADAWNEITERRKQTDFEEKQFQQKLEAEAREVEKMEEIITAVEALGVDGSDDVQTIGDSSQDWAALTRRLEELQERFAEDIEHFGLDEVTVAAIHGLFQREMADWRPLEQPTRIVTYLQRLHHLLIVEHDDTMFDGYDDFDPIRQQKSTTPYESLIHSYWLPKVRAAISSEWDVHDADPLLELIRGWKPVLPPVVFESVINDLIVPRLSTAIQKWNPRSSLKRKNHSRLPHIWLFPWLPYLDSHHTDPNASHGLLSDVKRKFRVVLDSWDLTNGVIPGLSVWKDVLGGTLQDALLRHLLPRLAVYLATEFDVYPPDQDLTPLERVFAWIEFLPRKAMSQLMLSEFFPKWLNTLHQWLINEPNYDEVAQWYTWWKSQIPEALNATPEVDAEWNKGLLMMNEAMELGDRVRDELTAPVAGPQRPIASVVMPKVREAQSTSRQNRTDEVISFRDIVEAWCEEQSLLLLPLREAHDVTGLPLFRVTASATGKGGVVVYLKGDVVWAQKKGEKGVFSPIELGDELMSRAEGR